MGASERLSRGLLRSGLVVSVWAVLPPFIPPDLETALATEIVDHVLPAVVVFVAIALASSRPWPRLRLFQIGLAVTVAGMFMVGSHIPLVVQALGGGAPWPGTIHHSLAPVAVLVLGLAWAKRYMAD